MSDRKCGSCTLCCRLLPVQDAVRVLDNVTRGVKRVIPTFTKPAMTKCEHQCSKGCRIYATRPRSCRDYACAWLVMPDAAALPRPDRAHFVIDSIPDYITVSAPGEAPRKIAALEVWLDPAFPEALHGAALRGFLALMGERYGMVAVIRGKDEKRRVGGGLIIFPPALSPDRKFHDLWTAFGEGDHTAEQTAEAMREIGLRFEATFADDEP